MGMTMEISKLVGRKIKEHREARGLTQVQLAKLMGKGVETISNFERGKTATSLLTLEQLSRHLNVAVKDFFADTEIPQGEPISHCAMQVRNASMLLPVEDLEIVAGLIAVLESRRRKT
ncbi:XRE family transcriptional regulator [Candidatus Terasakiella magnetica]|nr:XRE family transcriptional regulator [Candidatus Terasakiella magnetica]